ncbi:hypothetical protein AAFF_G00222310 [Aldrovandia affinis]|uniref:Uncharacterized protein n=1 Tax=Aldrovandia affinis TaxID=143900 RepID=A0AAD7W4Q4_9TELE|nr:hypothetical protein AAFF_G00222310 [Aldrovandia affinis]
MTASRTVATGSRHLIWGSAAMLQCTRIGLEDALVAGCVTLPTPRCARLRQTVVSARRGSRCPVQNPNRRRTHRSMLLSPLANALASSVALQSLKGNASGLFQCGTPAVPLVFVREGVGPGR